MFSFLHRTITTRTNNIISVILSFIVVSGIIVTISMVKDWQYFFASLVNVHNMLIFTGLSILLIYFTIFYKSKTK